MLNAQCTSLNPEGTRRHIRAALAAGATRDEVLFVLKCAALGAIHSCSLGAPILLEEARSAAAPLVARCRCGHAVLRLDEIDRPMERCLGPVLHARSGLD